MMRFFLLVSTLCASLLSFVRSTHAVGDAPHKVVVGAYINDLHQLDMTNHSYSLDFYLWFRWTDPEIDPPSTMEFMNAIDVGGMNVEKLYDEPQLMPDGSKYMVMRVQGQFVSDLPLARFPFDRQRLTVQFEDSNYDATGLQYVPDKQPISLSHGIAVPGFIIDEPEIEVIAHPYPTTLGDLRMAEPQPYSRVVVTIPLHRPVLANLIKMILPLLLVAACAALVYFIRPGFVEPRIGMSITALLALVALQITSNSQIPVVDDLVMLDVLYILGYVYVIASLVHAVLTTKGAEANDFDGVRRLDRRVFVMTSAVFALCVAATFMWFFVI